MSLSAGYHSGLCDCCKDTGVCLLWCFCCWTGVPQAVNWARAREEECGACHCFCSAHPLWGRRLIRARNGHFDHRHSEDCCTYFWCPCCAGAQDTRELKFLAQNAAGMQHPLMQPGSQPQPYA
jgi:hypothetical protein